MKETELKPCSCGCEAELVESQAFSWCDVTYYVRCTNPDCDERTELKYEHKIDAINAWNKKQEFLLPLMPTDKEKQIEEMARAMCGNRTPNISCAADDEPCGLQCVYAYCAKRLYEAGYRKIPTTDWLTKGISKEQLEREKQESLDKFAERNGYRKQSEGEWIEERSYSHSRRGYIEKITCSLCGKSSGLRKYNYCPNCGAKMKGGAE
jgi:hypothetical protein